MQATPPPPHPRPPHPHPLTALREPPPPPSPHPPNSPSHPSRLYAGLHIIFVAGLPRSGTTLVGAFIKLHAEVLGLLTADGLHGSTVNEEWSPIGSIRDFGGSADCLDPMCSAATNLSYLSSGADADHVRWQCEPYAERALHIADEVGRRPPQGKKWSFLQKHPATLLRQTRLAQSCASIGVTASFVQVERAGEDWEPVQGCEGECRTRIVRNSRACLDAARQNAAPSTYFVRFERFGDARMWEEMERALRLSHLRVEVRPGFPAGYRPAEQPAPTSLYHSPAAQHGRRAHLRLGTGGSNQSFAVYRGFLEAKCTRGPAQGKEEPMDG